MTQPEDGSEVSSSTLTVSGHTIPVAIVSVLVNEDIAIADVDKDGKFSATISLEEGPNIIEIIASDNEGGEQTDSVVVIYSP